MKYYKGKPLIFTNPHDEMIYEAGGIAALAELRAQVEALEEHIVERGDLWVRRVDVLALFDGDSE